MFTMVYLQAVYSVSDVFFAVSFRLLNTCKHIHHLWGNYFLTLYNLGSFLTFLQRSSFVFRLLRRLMIQPSLLSCSLLFAAWVVVGFVCLVDSLRLIRMLVRYVCAARSQCKRQT